NKRIITFYVSQPLVYKWKAWLLPDEEAYKQKRNPPGCYSKVISFSLTIFVKYNTIIYSYL
ncbi:hypothetical protein C3B58_12230, partial [Lactonifactor longoviformis]|uniref:hypothetical protein n=1 Tax=Lactonifactor longoviformis TaxID=341220 RepID=UPI000D4BBAAE